MSFTKSALLLMLLHSLGSSWCLQELRHRYDLNFKLGEFSNTGATAETFSGFCYKQYDCDVMIKMYATCENCENTPPIYYPSQYEYYQNTRYLGPKHFHNNSVSLVIDETTSDVVFHLIIAQVDASDRLIRKISHGKLNVTLTSRTWKLGQWDTIDWQFENRNKIRTQYLSVRTLVYAECPSWTCGSSCLVPADNLLKCDGKKTLCFNGLFLPECDEFHGNFSWDVNLLHFSTNYSQLELNHTCYEVAHACISEHCENPVRIGWTNRALSHNPNVQESDFFNMPATYTSVAKRQNIVNISLTTICYGTKVTNVTTFTALVGLTNPIVFKYSQNHRRLLGVIKSCYKDQFGWHCSHAANSSDTSQSSCSNGESSVSCAYKTLCRDHVCYNGGTCMLLRSSVDVDAYQHNELLDRELDKYSVRCECRAKFSGQQCEKRKEVDRKFRRKKKF